MPRKPPAPFTKSFVFYYSGEAVLVHTVPETPGNLRKPLETRRKPCRKPPETRGNLRNLFGNPAEKLQANTKRCRKLCKPSSNKRR